MVILHFPQVDLELPEEVRKLRISVVQQVSKLWWQQISKDVSDQLMPLILEFNRIMGHSSHRYRYSVVERDAYCMFGSPFVAWIKSKSCSDLEIHRMRRPRSRRRNLGRKSTMQAKCFGEMILTSALEKLVEQARELMLLALKKWFISAFTRSLPVSTKSRDSLGPFLALPHNYLMFCESQWSWNLWDCRGALGANPHQHQNSEGLELKDAKISVRNKHVRIISHRDHGKRHLSMRHCIFKLNQQADSYMNSHSWNGIVIVCAWKYSQVFSDHFLRRSWSFIRLARLVLNKRLAVWRLSWDSASAEICWNCARFRLLQAWDQ